MGGLRHGRPRQAGSCCAAAPGLSYLLTTASTASHRACPQILKNSLCATDDAIHNVRTACALRSRPCRCLCTKLVCPLVVPELGARGPT